MSMWEVSEEKLEALRKRWFELHPIPVAARRSVSVPGDRAESPAVSNLLDLTEQFRMYLISRYDYSTEPQLPRNYNKGTKNESPLLKCLTEITWVGNIAVGRDIRISFSEWWALCLPTNSLISFVGKGARERALQKAEELKEHY